MSISAVTVEFLDADSVPADDGWEFQFRRGNGWRKLDVDCPSIIRFGQMTQDEVFISHEAAVAGVTVENHSKTDPLVTLRYFGPDVHTNMPNVGDHARRS